MDKFNQLKEEIRNKKSARINEKDEILAMQTMLNDESFKYDKLNKYGEVIETVCPKEDNKALLKSVFAFAGLSGEELNTKVDNYTVDKKAAESYLKTTKSFVINYLDTNRKLSLGKTESASVSLIAKEIPKTQRKVIVGNISDGKTEMRDIPAHTAIKSVDNKTINKVKK